MPNMPGTWAIALAWLSQHSPILYAAALSCAMAVLRITYGGHSPPDAGGWAICGGLTLTIISGLDFFGLPQRMAISPMVGSAFWAWRRFGTSRTG
ncbi:phage holin family protein [Pseudomonas brassicacearum]|uniref:phage holin family protein n=1 Tax=Pseudomonas brassicacearum TaxID=930166 RepID=UPI003F6E35DF